LFHLQGRFRGLLLAPDENITGWGQIYLIFILYPPVTTLIPQRFYLDFLSL